MEKIKFIETRMERACDLFGGVPLKKEYVVSKSQLDRVAAGYGLTLSKEQKLISALLGGNYDEPICRYSFKVGGKKVIAECDRWTYKLIIEEDDQIRLVGKGECNEESFREDFVTDLVCVTVLVGGGLE